MRDRPQRDHLETVWLALITLGLAGALVALGLASCAREHAARAAAPGQASRRQIAQTIEALARATLDQPHEETWADWARDPHAVTPPALSGLSPFMELLPDREELPLLTLTPTEVLLGGAHLMDAPDRAALAAEGFPKETVDGGRRITPLALVLRPVHDALAPAGRPEETSLRLLLHAATPYRALFELLVAARHGGFCNEYLVIEGAGRERRSIAAHTWPPCGPFAQPRWSDQWPWIAIVLTPGGAVLRTDEGPVGPGCQPGEGLTIPGASSPAWQDQLTACLDRLIEEQPLADLGLSAPPDTPSPQVHEALVLLQRLIPRHGLGNYPFLFAPVLPGATAEWQRQDYEETPGQIGVASMKARRTRGERERSCSTRNASPGYPPPRSPAGQAREGERFE